MSDLRRDLTRLAFEIGATLNTVMDDDERDQLHGHVEKVINDELYAGSVNRAQVATVTDISSKRIQTAAVRPDFEAGDGRLQEV